LLYAEWPYLGNSVKARRELNALTTGLENSHWPHSFLIHQLTSDGSDVALLLCWLSDTILK